MWNDQAAPLLCAGATTFAALDENAKAGQDVAIIGIGGLGHVAIKIANAMGMRVTAFSGSIDEESLKKMGAYKVVNSRDEIMVECE